MEKEKNVYGEAVRRWCDMRGYSQDHMARKLGLRDSKTFSRYVTGESKFDLPMLEAIAAEVEAGSVANLLNSPDRVHIEHANQANSFGTNNNYHEANAALVAELKERIVELKEHIKHQHEELTFLRGQVEKLTVRG